MLLEGDLLRVQDILLPDFLTIFRLSCRSSLLNKLLGIASGLVTVRGILFQVLNTYMC